MILEHGENNSSNYVEIFGSSKDLIMHYKTSAHMHNNSNYEEFQEKNFIFDFTYVDRGVKVEIGDTAHVHYAGFLESNGRLFDSSIEYIWDNYGYFREGVTDANRHTATLTANNIGCDSPSTHENCDGGRQMILGFDQGMLGMYVGQTLYVVIPPEDAKKFAEYIIETELKERSEKEAFLSDTRKKGHVVGPVE